MKIRRIAAGAVAAHLVVGVAVLAAPPSQAAACTRTSSIVVVPLNGTTHRNVVRHAQDAVGKGYPLTMVLNRKGADARRKAAVKNVATRAGHDRDEYPVAVGRGVDKADVRLVVLSEYKSSRSLIDRTLRSYCDGTRFRYAGVSAKPVPKPSPKPTPTPDVDPDPTTPDPTTPDPTTPVATDPRYSTCTEAKKHGFGPYFRSSDPEYYWYQDRDRDGVVCE
jgi:Excalibur calcium-binding domain